MRTVYLGLGLSALAVGVVLNLLLSQLRSAFFRAFLPPWVGGSYLLIAAGVAFLILGAISSPSKVSKVPVIGAASLTGGVALVNTVAASVFILPLLVPSFRFPILITQWPGIYMVIAYASFVLVGVLGTVAWSFFYHYMKDVYSVSEVSRPLLTAQLLLTEVGVVGLAVSMFQGGYVGSLLAYQGAGPVIVGASMEFSVIPSAVSIFLVVAGTVAGVLNVYASGRGAK